MTRFGHLLKFLNELGMNGARSPPEGAADTHEWVWICPRPAVRRPLFD